MSGELLPAVPKAGSKLAARDVETLERHVAENVGRVESVEELREWRDQALALDAYLRSKKLNGPMLGAQRRVEARIGELLPKSEGGRGKTAQHADKFHTADRVSFRILAHALNGCELTEDEWRTSRRALVSLIRKRAGLVPETPPLPVGTFHTIVADPPWQLASGPQKLGGKFADAADHPGDPGGSPLPYEQMTVEAISALPVEDRAAPDSHLYLWTTNRHLEDAFGVVRAWGFQPATTLVWCKTPMGVGLGGTFRLTTEFVIFARRGKLGAERTIETTWWNWKRGRHSAKPAAFYELIESVSPGPRLDLFARREQRGWTVWGDEVADAE